MDLKWRQKSTSHRFCLSALCWLGFLLSVTSTTDHHHPGSYWSRIIPLSSLKLIHKHIQVPDSLTLALPCPPYLVGLKAPLEGWWLNWLEVNRLQLLNTHGEMKNCTFIFGVQSMWAWVGWSRLSFLLPTTRYVMVTGPGYMSSGSIISQNYILTCSHCLPR